MGRVREERRRNSVSSWYEEGVLVVVLILIQIIQSLSKRNA